MTVTLMDIHEVTFLKNAIGEDTGKEQIQPKVEEWYETSLVDTHWLQYLAVKDGVIGIFALAEFAHPNQGKDWSHLKDDYSKDYQKSTNEEILCHIKNLAHKIDNLIDFDVVIGKETGFTGVHELCIWFPMGTKRTEIEHAYHSLEGLELLF